MKLEASTRSAGATGELRRQGRIPAVVYNAKSNLSVSVELKAFDRVFRSQGTSNVIDLEVDGKVMEVLVKAVQMDKRRRVAQHADFYAVTAGQKVAVYVPIEYTGTAAGVRDGGQMDVQRREIHLSVIPRLIPHNLKLDVSNLKMGESLHVSDVVPQLPAEAEVLDDLELALVAVVAPRVAASEETPAAVEPELVAKRSEEPASEG